jgi:hypothetical protein
MFTRLTHRVAMVIAAEEVAAWRGIEVPAAVPQ